MAFLAVQCIYPSNHYIDPLAGRDYSQHKTKDAATVPAGEGDFRGFYKPQLSAFARLMLLPDRKPSGDGHHENHLTTMQYEE